MKKRLLFCLTLVFGTIKAFSAVGDSIRYQGVIYTISTEDSVSGSYEVRAVRYESPQVILPDSVLSRDGRGYQLTRVPYWYDSITCALTHYSKIDMSRCEHVQAVSYQYSRMIDIDTLVLPPNLSSFDRFDGGTYEYDANHNSKDNRLTQVYKLQPGIHRIFSSGRGSAGKSYDIGFYKCGALQEIDFSSYEVTFDAIHIDYCHFLEKCVLPNTLTWLGVGAALRLSTFNMPDSLEYIDFGTNQIEHLHLGPNVRKFNSQAFMYSYRCDSITVDSANPWLCSVDGVLFSHDTTCLVRYPYSKRGDCYVLPAPTKLLGSWAFYYAEIPSITEELSEENDYAKFVKQTLKPTAGSLHRIIFNDNLTGNNVTCYSLFYPSFSEECNSKAFVGQWGAAFGDKVAYHITDVCNFESTKISEIIASPFRYTYIDSIIMPSSLKVINKYGFADVSELEYIDFSQTDSLQEISHHVFAFCPKLKNIDLFHCSLVKSIGNGVFMNDVSLDSVVLPRNIESIGDSAFFGCTSLGKLVCPALVPIDLSHRLRVFDGVNTATCELVVPAPSIPIYQQAEVWKDFNITSNGLYTIGVALSDSLGGTVSGTRVCLYGDTAVLEVTVSEGYEFVSWSDGNTDNPRIVTATQDIVYTAIVHNLAEALPYQPHAMDDAAKPRKVLHNSNVYIETGDNTYTVTGISEN